MSNTPLFKREAKDIKGLVENKTTKIEQHEPHPRVISDTQECETDPDTHFAPLYCSFKNKSAVKSYSIFV